VGFIDRLPRIDCVQSDSSAAICHTIRRIREDADTNADPDWSTLVVDDVKATTVADSISVDRPRDGLAAVKAVIQSGGDTVTIQDTKILAAIPEIARATGVFAEPAAAAPWAALKQLVRDQEVSPDELLVCVVSGSGLKDIASARAAVGEPLAVDPSIDAVRDALRE
jgi:threonine synthase